jgi:hypothetical protein
MDQADDSKTGIERRYKGNKTYQRARVAAASRQYQRQRGGQWRQSKMGVAMGDGSDR